jgi:hypothetical protein
MFNMSINFISNIIRCWCCLNEAVLALEAHSLTGLCLLFSDGITPSNILRNDYLDEFRS